MRGLFLFLIVSVLLLLGAGRPYLTVLHPVAAKLNSSLVEKIKEVKAERIGKSGSKVASAGIAERASEHVFLDNSEDEDLSFARKDIPVHCILAFVCGSLFLLFASFRKNSLPFCWHLSHISSYKYILQRVLRI